jgi:hypothetical protein
MIIFNIISYGTNQLVGVWMIIFNIIFQLFHHLSSIDVVVLTIDVCVWMIIFNIISYTQTTCEDSL